MELDGVLGEVSMPFTACEATATGDSPANGRGQRSLVVYVPKLHRSALYWHLREILQTVCSSDGTKVNPSGYNKSLVGAHRSAQSSQKEAV
jgi:hypothetical protein